MTQLTDLFEGQLPKLVLFDLDGTLVDSVPDLAAAVDYMLTEGGYEAAGPDHVRRWVGNGASMLVRRALAWAKRQSPEDLSDALVELNLEKFQLFYRDHSADQTELFVGIREGLDALKAAGIPLMMVTNKPEQFVPAILKGTGLEGYFGAWLGGNSLPEKKPHPMPLLHLVEKAGVEVADTLMIGDSRSDIEAARAAGMPVVAVSYGYNHGRPVSEESPDLIIDSLTELTGTIAAEVA
ncbi:phosphoglycolate phosphatase [Maricurvus nonylphenolicus]|uniref:phosphoglycolate phosphatase n=1 Tax=Maricurvus nonylphenolicus TaxID=1008307 RepID=UPI0036F38221